MQNLTSYSCLATLISYKGDEISRLSRIVFEIPILGYFGVLEVWGVFTYLQSGRVGSSGHRVNCYRVGSGHGSILLTRFHLWCRILTYEWNWTDHEVPCQVGHEIIGHYWAVTIARTENHTILCRLSSYCVSTIPCIPWQCVVSRLHVGYHTDRR